MFSIGRTAWEDKHHLDSSFLLSPSIYTSGNCFSLVLYSHKRWLRMDSSGRERKTKCPFRGPTRKFFQVLHNLQPLGGLSIPEYIFLIENTLFGIVGVGWGLPLSFNTVSNSKQSIKIVRTLKSLI